MQPVHTDTEVAPAALPYFPARHAVHALASVSALYSPLAAHAVHTAGEVAPVTLPYAPATHAVHVGAAGILV